MIKHATKLALGKATKFALGKAYKNKKKACKPIQLLIKAKKI